MNLSAEQAAQAMANIGYVFENDITQMIAFVDKLVELNNAVSLDSENNPSNITSSSEFKSRLFQKNEYLVDNLFNSIQKMSHQDGHLLLSHHL